MILLLHAYSASNKGDGLLVEESVELIREAFNREVPIIVAALRPDTFSPKSGVVYVNGNPRHLLGPNGLGRWLLRHKPSLIVGVGGGYLRGKNLRETLKMGLAHLPQLALASLSRVPAVYLPQSIGPFPRGVQGIVRLLLGGLTTVFVRDDRSLKLVATPNVRRVPDLAILGGRWASRNPARVPVARVLSVRYVAGQLPTGVHDLASLIRPFEGYVQSSGGGNDDSAATAAVRPDTLLTDLSVAPRVVIAVRLHAALMALREGHYVVHLAYERKGFGAFEDLGLRAFVHNVNSFDPNTVREQVEELMGSADARARYDVLIAASRAEALAARSAVVEDLAKSGAERARR